MRRKMSRIAPIAAVSLVAAVAFGQAQEKMLAGAEAYGDYTRDAPGVWHKITVADLQAPFHTEPARNASRPSGKREAAVPKVMPGFSVTAFAEELKQPRQMKVAPNGDIFRLMVPSSDRLIF